MLFMTNIRRCQRSILSRVAGQFQINCRNGTSIAVSICFARDSDCPLWAGIALHLHRDRKPSIQLDLHPLGPRLRYPQTTTSAGRTLLRHDALPGLDSRSAPRIPTQRMLPLPPHDRIIARRALQYSFGASPSRGWDPTASRRPVYRHRGHPCVGSRRGR